jgi:hypothetical protein
MTTTYAPLTIVPLFGTSITGLTGTGGDPTTTAQVENVISAAVSFFDTNFTSSVPAILNSGTISNGVTVDISFDYGTVAGSAMTAGSGAGQSQSTGNVFTSYGSVQSVLPGLPASDPTGGGAFLVPFAQEQMLGMISNLPAQTDGSVGLNTIANGVTLDWNLANQSIAGQTGALGVVEHEISEVFGRVGILGAATSGSTPLYTLLDLFRYSAPGTPALTLGPGQYFSLNNGTTDIAGNLFNAAAGADPGDWNGTAVPADAFDATQIDGTAGTISALDQTVLTSIGFQLVACYAEGTRLLTAEGPRPIESIAVGDELHTLLGGPGRVIWVGRRLVDAKRHPRPQSVWPVRIEADAFAPGLPERDLYLSPDHAVYVDGVLIPAKHLLNGASIRQVPVEAVVYYHVELERHDVILAEGLPAETYLDTGDRHSFEGAAVTALHPYFAERLWEMAGCAPLVLTGPALETVRQRLRQREDGSRIAGRRIG